jgi:ABC-2 type transport system ATP-binding protein
MSAAVAVEELRHSFGETVAVDGISLWVDEGDMFGLIGPDGAGKTTTLRCVLGLLAAESGSVRTCGLDPWRQRRELSRSVGYLAQRFSLYGDLTVDENVAFFARVHGVRRWRPRRDELLELLRMTPFRKRLADRLSGGMRQKLALACTLIHTPRLLVLDEPTTGVDPVSRRDFWRILSRLRREGMTIFLTTPYLDEAERCGRVALMDRGRILVTDTPDALRDHEAGVTVEVLARPARRAREVVAGMRGAAEAILFGERLHVTFPGDSRDEAESVARRVGEALKASSVEVETVRPILPSLEGVFISRIRSAPARPEEAA